MPVHREFKIVIEEGPGEKSYSISRQDTYSGDTEAFPHRTVHLNFVGGNPSLDSLTPWEQEDISDLLTSLDLYCPEGEPQP